MKQEIHQVKSCYYFAEAVAKILVRLMNDFMSVIQVHCFCREISLGYQLDKHCQKHF